MNSVLHEWFELALTFVAHISWPVAILILLLIFRGPLTSLIDNMTEFEGWGVKAKTQRGNQRAKSLSANAADDGAPDVPKGGENGQKPPTEENVEADDQEDLGLTKASVLNSYERIVIDRLKMSAYNTDTTSARLGAEIVGNTYADLKQSVRMVSALFGRVGIRGRLQGTEVILDGFTHDGMSGELRDDILGARDFATDVQERKVAVDGSGAEEYIRTVSSLVTRLFKWARGVLEAEKNGSEQLK